MKKMFALAVACSALSGSVLSGSVVAAPLLEGSVDAGKAKAASCAACHGADGNSAAPTFPKLAGQSAGYLYKQLMDFAQANKNEAGNPGRPNATMQAQVKGLSDQDMKDLAVFYASQTIKPGSADEKLVEQGQKLWRGGDAAGGIPACIGCHGPNGQGIPTAKFPALAGQHAAYTAAQLKMFRSGERKNDAGAMMRNITERMTDKQIDALASYIQGLR